MKPRIFSRRALSHDALARCAPLLFLPAALLLSSCASRAAVTSSGDEIVLSSARYRIGFDAKNGAISSVTQSGQKSSIWKSGEYGLWRVRFRDNSEINAAAFSANSQSNRFTAVPDAKNNALNLRYQNADIKVDVRVLAREGGAEFSAQVTPAGKTLLDFYLPARMRFAPDSVKKFVFPANGNQNVGIGFKKSFFARQSDVNNLAWSNSTSGVAGYTQLFGAPPQQRPDDDALVSLSLTPTGREWLSPDLVARIEAEKARVNRAPQNGQADLVLVDSPNGAYFSASRLGGSGALWRIGGFVGNERTITLPMVANVVTRLANNASTRGGATAGEAKPKIALLNVIGGPPVGAGSEAAVSEWNKTLRALPAVTENRVTYQELRTLPEIDAALRDKSFVAIVNPYGEMLPSRAGDLKNVVARIGDYVRGGGNWLEVGGFSFYTAMSPARYLSYFLPYPAAFADFVHLDSTGGQAAIYGVQPRRGAAFSGAKNHDDIFVPGKLQVGGDENGGYSERAFGVWIEAGKSWKTPMVFMGIGGDASTRARDYCVKNEINKTLNDKMSPQLLARFKAAPLIYFGGSARQKIDGLPLLPEGSLIHFADYLRYGFDRGLPDMLPPSESFGTMADMKELFSKAKSAGHLVMPYTNTSWWSKPKGETWLRDGDAGLVKLPPDNHLSYERYGENDGYTASQWHPLTRAASRKVVTQFTTELPVDVLFQDQVAARSWIMGEWIYDMNPASPTPYAYLDGLYSQAQEDSARVPLSTEAAGDKSINFESQFCGMTFDIMPSVGYTAPQFWTQFPADTEIFPLIQLMAHDKVLLNYHDLGQFVTNDETLSWMLGLGFNVNAQTDNGSLRQNASRQWLLWLNQVQKKIAARYAGTPMTAWQHLRPADVSRKGVIRATYGDVKIVANLDDASTRAGNLQLPPFGFYVTAPGLVAGNLPQENGNALFITETRGGKTETWIYATEDRTVDIELPSGSAAKTFVLQDDSKPQTATATLASTRNNAKSVDANAKSSARVRVTLPRRATGETIAPPAELAGKAPLQWARKPKIGIVDFGGTIQPSWSRISVADWESALNASPLVKQNGVAVERLTTPQQIKAALQNGPTGYLVLVNPYGELFPSVGADWHDSLALIKNYVRHGGNWWEVAGHSLYQPATFDGAKWNVEVIGSAGLSEIGLPISGGTVEQAAESLQLGADAKNWLDAAASTRVTESLSAVNRSLPRGTIDPGHVSLVGGRDGDFIGGYRFDGWGYLWRIGGFFPNPQAVLPVVISATQHLFQTPPAPRAPSPIKELWHLTGK